MEPVCFASWQWEFLRPVVERRSADAVLAGNADSRALPASQGCHGLQTCLQRVLRRRSCRDCRHTIIGLVLTKPTPQGSLAYRISQCFDSSDDASTVFKIIRNSGQFLILAESRRSAGAFSCDNTAVFFVFSNPLPESWFAGIAQLAESSSQRSKLQIRLNRKIDFFLQIHVGTSSCELGPTFCPHLRCRGKLPFGPEKKESLFSLLETQGKCG